MDIGKEISLSTDQVWTAVLPLLEKLKAQIICLVPDAEYKAKISHERVFEAAVLSAISSLVNNLSETDITAHSLSNNSVSLQIHERMRQCALDLKEELEQKNAELQVERKRAHVASGIIEKLRSDLRQTGAANANSFKTTSSQTTLMPDFQDHVEYRSAYLGP